MMPPIIEFSPETLLRVNLVTIWVHYEEVEQDWTEIYHTVPRLAASLVVRDDGTFFVRLEGESPEGRLGCFRHLEYVNLHLFC